MEDQNTPENLETTDTTEGTGFPPVDDLVAKFQEIDWEKVKFRLVEVTLFVIAFVKVTFEKAKVFGTTWWAENGENVRTNVANFFEFLSVKVRPVTPKDE